MRDVPGIGWPLRRTRRAERRPGHRLAVGHVRRAERRVRRIERRLGTGGPLRCVRRAERRPGHRLAAETREEGAGPE